MKEHIESLISYNIHFSDRYISSFRPQSLLSRLYFNSTEVLNDVFLFKDNFVILRDYPC